MKGIIGVGAALVGMVMNVGVAMATPYYADITVVGTSAEMMGIGNVQGFSQQASVLLESPAGLGYAKNSFSGFYTSFYGGAQYMTGAFSFSPKPNVTIGVAGAYQRSTGLDVTATNNANEYIVTDQFDADVVQGSIGMAYKLTEALSLGVAWTTYATNLYDVHGSGSDWSAALRVKTHAGDIVVTGKNILGSDITFNDASTEKLARQWSLGFKSVPTRFLSSEVFAQLKQIEGVDAIAKSGGVRIFPLEDNTLSVSIGYKEKQVVTSLKSSIAAGAILNLDSFAIEYGYDTTDAYEDNQQHYVSFSIKY